MPTAVRVEPWFVSAAVLLVDMGEESSSLLLLSASYLYSLDCHLSYFQFKVYISSLVLKEGLLSFL